jgi:hypothetical protein
MTWRSLGDSNPCFRRERAKFADKAFAPLPCPAWQHISVARPVRKTRLTATYMQPALEGPLRMPTNRLQMQAPIFRTPLTSLPNGERAGVRGVGLMRADVGTRATSQ